MDGNNSWQRMGQFARLPRRDLGPVSRPPARELVPVEQLMGGGGEPMPAIMPQQQNYDEGQPSPGKKILGMPKDQFIALMGTIAQAFGGDSASGRMGAGLVNMAGMMRQERMGQAETRAAETKAKRKAVAEAAKEKRGAAAKKKEKAPTVRTFRVGDMDVQHAYDYDVGEWKPISGMAGKKVKEVKDEKKAPTIRTFRIGDKDIQHAWDVNTGDWKPIPGMPGKKITPPAGEKPLTPTEKRAQRKELRGLEETILGVDPKTGKANVDYPEVQISIDSWNELSDKSFVYKRTPGTPEKKTGWFDLERDVKAVPAILEEIPISQFKTPEDIKRADYLSYKAKRRLLLKRFSKEFEQRNEWSNC